MSTLQNVRAWGDGSFSAIVPTDPAIDEARNAALRAMAEDQQMGWDAVQQALPHRSERRPLGFEQRDRDRQERSLGREARPRGRFAAAADEMEPELYLHPMAGDVYLYSLAVMLPELAERLVAMAAEMATRPEQFGKDEKRRLFDLATFRGCGREWPEDRAAEAAAEATLAAFVCWVARPHSANGLEAAAQVLPGLGMWSERSRWTV